MGIRRWTSPAIGEEIAGAGSDCYRESQRQQRFFFHGQFNTGLAGAVEAAASRRRSLTGISGGRICENSASLKFRLFYPLRRMAQGE